MQCVRLPAHASSTDLYAAHLVEWHGCRLPHRPGSDLSRQTQGELAVLIPSRRLLLFDDLETHLPEVALQCYAIVPDLGQLLELLGARRVHSDALLQIICASV